MINDKQFSIAIAGSTHHTVTCAEAISNDNRFQISWVLTPEPKVIGRKKVVTKNPLHLFAEQNNIPVILVKEKIDTEIRNQLILVKSDSFEKPNDQPTSQPANQEPDFLLVVDFGYYISNWLLQLPKVAPLNIHPSELPKYRGSSPGQFALLFGEQKSAVTLMIMNNKLDEGNLISQIKFDVLNTWTSVDYYHHAFQLISEELPNLIFNYGSLSEVERQRLEVVQPLTSPTPLARRLTRDDGFICWPFLTQYLPPSFRKDNNTTQQQNNVTTKHSEKSSQQTNKQTSPLLLEAYEQLHSWAEVISNAIRAFTPWPGVWTIVPTNKGEKRMKILSVNTDDNQLTLETVQLEGLQPTRFEEVKNQLVSF